MIPIDLATIAEVTGGRLHNASGDERISSSVEFDTRALTPGGLFLALPGQRSDGHDFAGQAMERGATAVLAGREVPFPAVIAPPCPEPAQRGVLALAGDRDGTGAAVLAALAKLANHVLATIPECAVVGVTGSCGKTSTKNLIGHLVAPLAPTVVSPRSFNNELGQPWTILRADSATRHLILELGTRGAGQLAALCRTATPKIGLVLNVGDAHLGKFGSQDAIAAAKGELVEALPNAASGGVAVLNRDDDRVLAMRRRTAAEVVFFGRSARAHVRATDIALDRAAKPHFTLHVDTAGVRGTTRIKLPAPGDHQVDNALAATAVALHLGASLEDVARRLEEDHPRPPHRMAVHSTHDDVLIIDDARNASSGSMRAALRTLSALGTTRPGRLWAVLGGMRGLGAASDAKHDDLGRFAADIGVDRLLSVGDGATRIHEAAVRAGGGKSPEATHLPDAGAAIELLRAELRPGDTLLVKGARVAALWQIADALLPDHLVSTGWDSDFPLVPGANG